MQVRLFLDGRWTSVLIDDFLPTTEKQRRPDGTGLAYARCTGQQLWVSFIAAGQAQTRFNWYLLKGLSHWQPEEKAYAKAHGAYRFISGGETSEAFLELTGAPTEVVHFQAAGWVSLSHQV